MSDLTLSQSLYILRTANPWPESPPDVKPDLMGWLAPETAAALTQRLTPETQLVIECGTWLGTSATAILNAAPNATLLCIDTWAGSPEHHRKPGWSKYLPTLFATFLRNMWEYRERLIFIPADSLVGLGEVFTAGVVPDLIYLDTAHECGRLTAELAVCREFWPGAAIVLDDYTHAVVAKAAICHATLFQRELHVHDGVAASFDGIVP